MLLFGIRWVLLIEDLSSFFNSGKVTFTIQKIIYSSPCFFTCLLEPLIFQMLAFLFLSSMPLDFFLYPLSFCPFLPHYGEAPQSDLEIYQFFFSPIYPSIYSISCVLFIFNFSISSWFFFMISHYLVCWYNLFSSILNHPYFKFLIFLFHWFLDYIYVIVCACVSVWFSLLFAHSGRILACELTSPERMGYAVGWWSASQTVKN